MPVDDAAQFMGLLAEFVGLTEKARASPCGWLCLGKVSDYHAAAGHGQLGSGEGDQQGSVSSDEFVFGEGLGGGDHNLIRWTQGD